MVAEEERLTGDLHPSELSVVVWDLEQAVFRTKGKGKRKYILTRADLRKTSWDVLLQFVLTDDGVLNPRDRHRAERDASVEFERTMGRPPKPDEVTEIREEIGKDLDKWRKRIERCRDRLLDLLPLSAPPIVRDHDGRFTLTFREWRSATRR